MRIRPDMPDAVDVMVTGSDGFIGRHLCHSLEQIGLSVYRADLTGGIDLSDPASIEDIPPFGVAVHLAARTFVPDSFRDPGGFFHTNINTTLNVLEACRRHRARLIFASTYLYGQPVRLPIDESHPIEALNPYAHSKYAAEALCRAYAQAGEVPVLIFRPFNVYGPGQDSRFLIPSFLRQWEQGRVELKDPDPRRDYLYVDDMVNAYVRAVQMDLSSLEIMNIGSGSSHSVRELAEMMASMLPGEAEIIFTGEVRQGEIRDTCADISRATRLLVWTPQVSLKEGLQLTIANYFTV